MIRVVIVPVMIDGRTGVQQVGAPSLSPEMEERVMRAARNAGALRDEEVAPPPPPVSRAPQSPARNHAAPLNAFLSDCCESAGGVYICATDLYRGYRRWASQTGDRFPLSRPAFNELMLEAGYRYSRSRRIEDKQCRTWEGVALLPDAPRRNAVGARRSLDDVRTKLRRALAALEEEV